MFILAGNVGRLYVGYKLAATITGWEAVRADAPLGNRTIVCKGCLSTYDMYWVTQPPTRLALRTGPMWWVWSKIDGIEHSGGNHVTVRAAGDPVLLDNID
jgi:hypothetical protein